MLNKWKEWQHSNNVSNWWYNLLAAGNGRGRGRGRGEGGGQFSYIYKTFLVHFPLSMHLVQWDTMRWTRPQLLEMLFLVVPDCSQGQTIALSEPDVWHGPWFAINIFHRISRHCWCRGGYTPVCLTVGSPPNNSNINNKGWHAEPIIRIKSGLRMQ